MTVTIRSMGLGEIPEVVSLLRQVFEAYVRPDYNEEGWTSLMDYVNVDAMRKRNEGDHRSWIAEVDGDLAGVLELRRLEHVSQLVVDERFFRRGIARRLVREAIEQCREENPGLQRLTVHSSPYAMGAYTRLGFAAVAGELVVDGIRFTPMALELGSRRVEEA